jgi:hypothetical protein
MDFIIKLSMSKKPGTDQSYNFIFIATDRLTKYGYFISYRKNILAEDLAYLFNKHVISQYKIPKKIISDRNKLFRRF